MAKLELLTDNFSGVSLDTGKWTSFGDGTGATVSGGLLTTTADASGYGAAFAFGAVGHDLTDSYGFVKFVSVSSGGVAVFSLSDTVSGEAVSWQYHASLNEFWCTDDDGVAFATIPAVGGTFLRIREASGTIYWDHSTPGTSWTNTTSRPVGDVLTQATDLLPAVGVTVLSGTSTATFDSFNIPAAAPTNLFFF